MFFHNSHIIHSNINQPVFGYFDLYFVPYINIKSDMKTAEKIVNTIINENIFPIKVSLLRQDM